MASVRIDFEQPTDEGLALLRIFEGPTANGPFVEIEEVVAIGAYPDYISHYTTQLATDPDAWFAIQWEDAQGAVSELSNPFQGGTSSVIGEIVDRIKQRDSAIKEAVARQEAESLLESYFNADPYTVDLEGHPRKYRILNGITLMALARSYISTFAAGGQYEQWTSGLVSVRSGSSSSLKFSDVQKLFQEGAHMLGLNGAVIARMAGLPIAGGVSDHVREDTTRLLLMVSDA